MSERYEETLQNLRENLRIIEERCSQYVYETDIPLQDLRERDRLKKRIASLELQRGIQEKQDIIERANLYLSTLDDIARRLAKWGWSETAIRELDQWVASIEVNKEVYEKTIEGISPAYEDILKKKQSIVLLLRQADRVIRKYEQVSDYLETHPVSSATAFSNITPPSLFIDREEILQNLEDNFDSYNILVIAGVGGIGKTYLIKQFISGLKDYRTLWINCSAELTIEQFFFTISECLAKDYGVFDIDEALKDKNRLTENKVAFLLQQLDKLSLCIIIDDFHTANDEFEPLVNLFDKYTKKIKFLIITRRRSQSLRSIYYSAYIENLSGIGIGQVKYYLSRYRLHIKEELVKPIYEKTTGHPLALRLFASLCVVDRYDPEELLSELADVFGKRLEVELIAKINQELESPEKELLSRFSVFRIPVRREAIRYIYDNNTEIVLNSLLHRLLITEPIEREFLTHDLIREFFYDQLTDKSLAHLQAAQYYLKLSTETNNLDDRLEAYYHFYKAGYYDEALKIVFSVINRLETEAKFELVLELIRQMEVVLERPPLGLWVHRARILEIWGRWNDALNILTEIIENSTGNADVLLAALNTALHIYDLKGEHKQGLVLFDKFSPSIQLDNHTPELAHLYHRLGRMHHEVSFEKAINYYNKSLEISTLLNDRVNMARTGRLIGVANWFFGHYDEALEQLNKVLVICREDNYQRELSDTLKHIAIVWTKKHEYEKSLEPFQESIEISTRLGYKHSRAWSLLGVAEAYIALNRLDEAEDLLNQSLNVFQELSERNGIIRTTHPLAHIHIKRGNYDEAIEVCKKSLDLAQELNSPTAEGEILETMFQVYKIRNEKELYIEALSKAIDIYKSIGSERLTIVEDEFNRLENNSGGTEQG